MTEASLEISIANDLRELAGVAAKVDAFCDARGVGAGTAYAVNLSIDEILSNTIGHGYDDDEAHRIELIVRLDGATVTVVIVDDARAFDVSAPAAGTADVPLEERALGGLGLFLVRRMMDRVEYRRQDGCNVVTLSKETDVEP